MKNLLLCKLSVVIVEIRGKDGTVNLVAPDIQEVISRQRKIKFGVNPVCLFLFMALRKSYIVGGAGNNTHRVHCLLVNGAGI